MNPIVFCAAIPQEVKPLCRRLGIAVPGPNRRIVKGMSRDGCPVCVITPGVGQERMEKLLEEVPNGPVLCWVSVGFAGGLAPSLSAGDCVIGHTVLTDRGETFQFPDTAGYTLFNHEKPGILYCSQKAVFLPEDKMNIHRETDAAAVDMESASVARFAQQRDEPFIWIRVISDTSEECVPEEMIECLAGNGFPSITAAIQSLISKPSLLPAFLRMGRRSKLCASQLAEAVLPWMMIYHSPAVK